MINHKASLIVVPTREQDQSLEFTISLIRAIKKAGYKVAFYQPIKAETSTSFIKDVLLNEGVIVGKTFSYSQAYQLIAHNNYDQLFEEIVEEQNRLYQEVDIIVAQGIVDNNLGMYINNSIARTMDASIIIFDQAISNTIDQMLLRISSFAIANLSGYQASDRILGAVIQHNFDIHAVSKASANEITNIPLLIQLEGSISRKLLESKVTPEFVKSILDKTPVERRLSPAFFRNSLTKLAQSSIKKIVLPEGDEPRTLKAVAFCQSHKIADCILLANPESVKKVCLEHHIDLPSDVTIIDPQTIAANYVERLVELRSSKGMTVEKAQQELQDNVMIGTMMLELDQVDGLVSGAVHTTANTIRPALQIIKTAPGSKIVSSCFFMLLPDQVLVYADCAINTNPNAEQLANIAIQSADTALSFGISPRVALISYSTLGSGTGPDVEIVEQATQLVRELRPDLLVDGPLQYDAASVPEVAKSKAPNSKVAGKATVYIFPNLSVGNAIYKGVQRSAEVISVGPMLQGLNKPVNDLSRGALVQDIIYTIALTAIQAINR